MNFEDRMRQLAAAILQYEADTLAKVDWDGRMQLSALGDPETALLVADVITAARDRIGTDYDIASPLEYAITLLDEHYAKDSK